MIEIVFGRDDDVAAWVAQRLPGDLLFRNVVAMGIVNDGRPIAGIVFSEFRGHDIHLTIASEDPRWCCRRVLRAVFTYVFVQLRCARCTATTGKSNRTARNLLSRLGFRQEGAHPCAMNNGTETAISFGMTRADCRWTKEPR